MPTDELLEALHASDQRLIRSVDSLADGQWREPSLLPGWTRAHVVAHLALNAEGFERAIGGVQDGEVVPVYDSNESRDADIEQLAVAEVSEIRDRLFAATTALRHAFGGLTAAQWEATVNRLPVGPVWPVSRLVLARSQELEIHHVDLDAGYVAADWPSDFLVPLLERLAHSHGLSDQTADFAVHATDLDRTLDVGADSPLVTGTAADLAWWLLGRSDGSALTAHGSLPALGPWMNPAPQGR